ncbi:hypothetical protein BDV24DRAFT_17470 [Aspergillus arachidicola]|uniref:Uncharacterized protein n=1 Tax=Aspergillus arachidicola TaxID=656916 RepID=A0A5N6YHR2_9EURO|nr:hypothetical protein BDV24DRAFT_17470 [Aspergillus arachidicola]
MPQNVLIGLSLHFARAKPLIHSAGWQSSFFRRISVYIIVLPPTVVLKRFVLLFPGQRLQCRRTSFVLFRSVFSTFLLWGASSLFHSDRVLRSIEHLAESVRSLLSFAIPIFSPLLASILR